MLLAPTRLGDLKHVEKNRSKTIDKTAVEGICSKQGIQDKRDFRDPDQDFFVENETRDFLLKIGDFETEFRDSL